jgi:RNA polymerase sigma-70 factor (ECF subfamily)
MQQPGTSEGTFQHSPHNAGPIRSAELAQRRGLCTQDPDEVLLRCLRTHAPGAFESLVERYMHRLLKTASRITKSHEEAEDVVQETFLTVYRHVAGFRGECKLSTWLTTITRNHALMVLRKKRHPVLSIDAASGNEGHTISTTLIATGSSPEDKCIDQQLLDRLLLSIERLPSHRRDIFELHFAWDMRTAEIAQLQGISVSAVKSRLHRTTRDLRQKRFTPSREAIQCSRPSQSRMNPNRKYKKS